MSNNLQESAKKFDIKVIFITSIVTALALVTGLFWNDAVRSAIEVIFPARDAVSAKFIAAAMVTVIVAFIIFLIYKAQEIKVDKLVREQTRLLARQHRRFEVRRRKFQRGIVRGSR